MVAKKECYWLRHQWVDSGGGVTDVYERNQHCSRCDTTRVYRDGVTVDKPGKLKYFGLIGGALMLAIGALSMAYGTH